MDREKAFQIIWDRCQHSKETEKALEVLKEERPHGKWEGKPESKLLITRRCTACGERGVVGNFCWLYGADMRKEGDTNDQL